MALVLEQGFDTVTVGAIIARADVARATFYAHYADQHDLLTAIVEELASDLTARVLPQTPTGHVVYGTGILELYVHADQNRELYRVVLSGAADGRARRAYAAIVGAAIEQAFTQVMEANHGVPRLPIVAAAKSWTGSHLALLEWWLNEVPDRSADEIALISLQLLVNGYPWGAGLEPGQLVLDTSAYPSHGDARSVSQVQSH